MSTCHYVFLVLFENDYFNELDIMNNELKNTRLQSKLLYYTPLPPQHPLPTFLNAPNLTKYSKYTK